MEWNDMKFLKTTLGFIGFGFDMEFYLLIKS